MKKILLLPFLIGWSLCSWGQWNVFANENTRISSNASTVNKAALQAITNDGRDGYILCWVERANNASEVYVQQYDANGTPQYTPTSGKNGRLIFTQTGDITDPNCRDGIRSMGLFRADGANQVILVYTVKRFNRCNNLPASYLKYQVINIADGAPQIPTQPGTDAFSGHTLTEYCGSTAFNDLQWHASFVPNGGKLAIVSTYRRYNDFVGGTDKGSDIRVDLIDLNSPAQMPSANILESENGNQVNPRIFGAAWGSGVVIFVAHTDDSRFLHIKRYNLSGNSLTKQYSNRIDNLANIEQIIQIQNAIVQPSTDELVVYTRNGGAIGVGTDIYAHRFRPSNGSLIGVTPIIKSGPLNDVGLLGGINGRTAFVYINQTENAQVMRVFNGATAVSNEVEVITKGYTGGGVSLTGYLIDDEAGTQQYFITGTFNNQIFGQIIRVNSAGAISRIWANEGRTLCNASTSQVRFNLRHAYVKGAVNPYVTIWEDERHRGGNCNGDVYAQALDFNGNMPDIIRKPTLQSNVCVGASVPISFGWLAQGFSPTFSATILDEAGVNVIRNLPETSTSTGPLTVVIPRDLPIGKYKVQINGRVNNPAVTFPYKSPVSDVFTVNPLPIIKATSPKTTYAQGETIELQATGGTVYEWSGPATFASANQNPTRPMATTAMSGKYIVRGQSGVGCIDTSSVTITVVSVSISKPALNRAAFCVRDTLRATFTLVGTFSAGNVFTAEILNEGGTSVVVANTGTATGSPLVVVIPTTLPNGRYRLRVKSSNPALNNVQNSDVFTVTATPTIAAAANNTKPLSVCAGVAVTLSATDGFASYNWTGPGITTGANTRSPQLATPVTGSYVVTGTSTCGTARDTVKVTVNPIPVPNASSSKSTYIVGETIQFNSGGGTGYTYLWTGPGFSGAETRQNPTISNAQTTMTGDYTVTIRANGCTAKGTVNITVTTQPVTGIDNVSATPSSACPGTGIDVNFTIIPSNGVGTFNVYLADANGQKIGTSIGSGARSPIRATLSASAAPGNTYRILVETSPTISKSSSSAFTVLQRATAQMLSPTKDTSIVARKTGDNLSARMRIQGSGPFTLNFSAGTRTVRNAGDTTLTFRFENDGVFSFQSISNACGAGGLTGVQSVRITLKRVVAVEEDTLANSSVVVFPNPISDRLNVQIKQGKVGQTTQLRLYDLKGSLLKTQFFYNDRYQWEMGSFPVGNYLLEVVQEDKKQSFRVIKE